MTQRIDLKQRMLVGIAIAKALDRAAGTGSNAKQTEDIFVDGLKNAHVSEERVQRFRDGLAKARQSKEFSSLEDVYVMGAIVVYSGILLQVLIGLGVPDLPSRLALPGLAPHVLNPRMFEDFRTRSHRRASQAGNVARRIQSGADFIHHAAVVDV